MAVKLPGIGGRDDRAQSAVIACGTQKAVAELLINDYTRRGFVDGRVLRLPTISVRPGSSERGGLSRSPAESSREPLDGQEAVCPVDPQTRLWLSSPSAAVDSLIAVHDVALGSDRILNALGSRSRPGRWSRRSSASPVAEVASRVRWERDARIARIVATWPGALDTTRGPRRVSRRRGVRRGDSPLHRRERSWTGDGFEPDPSAC